MEKEEWKKIFTSSERVSEEILQKLEEYIEPYKDQLEKATIYKTKEKKEILSDKRESWKTIIESSEIHSFLQNYLMAYIQDDEYEFEILPSHFDYMEYDKGGHFDKHIDFVSNHTNFSKQYTCILGLETCESGYTQIWEGNMFYPYCQSIRRGGLVWFDSECLHYGEEMKDKDKKKRIFTFSLRGMKKSDLQEEKVIWISKEGKKYYIQKSLIEKTFYHQMEGNGEVQTDLTDRQMELILRYLKEEELTISEMSEIREPLGFLMLIYPEFMDHEVPAKEMREMNEKWRYKDYMVFNKFEPWMVEWAKKNDLIPFQMICHWNDFTTYNQYDPFDGRCGSKRHQMMKRILPKMQRINKNKMEQIKKVIEDVESFNRDYYDLENDMYMEDIEEMRLSHKTLREKVKNTEDDVFDEYWLNADYVVTMGNMKYVEGDGYLAKLCQKMNEKEVFEKKSLMNKMKNLIHFHQYNMFQHVLEHRYEKFVKRSAPRNYTYGYFKKHKTRDFVYGESKNSYIHYCRKDDFSQSDPSTRYGSDSDSTVSSESSVDLCDKLVSFCQAIDKGDIQMEGVDSDSGSDDSNFDPIASIQQNQIEEEEPDQESIRIVDLKKHKLESTSEMTEDTKVIQLNLTQGFYEESDEEEEENEQEEVPFMPNEEEDSSSSSESQESEESEESEINDYLENRESTESGSSGSFSDLYERPNLPSLHGMETIHSDDPRITKAYINEDESNVYMQRFHDVHFNKFTESFDEKEISEEEKMRIRRAVRDISFHEAYDFRDHIFERYYDESCNEGDDVFYHYKFKVYYVYYGFLKRTL